MNEQKDNDLVRLLTIALADMKQSLAAIAGAMATGLDIRKPIQEYTTFDWSSIAAEVTREDEDGPSIVRWNGKFYKRRSPSNKFEPSIWFSRCVGKREDGSNNYETLISFDVIKDDVEPISPKARALAFPNTQSTRPRQEPKDDGVSELKGNASVDLDQLSARLAKEGRVIKVDGVYKVQVNDRVSYQVTKAASGKVICNCERFETISDTKGCEHVRAVRLSASAPARSRQAA
ncbi:MAG TPA: single-stranded DNA-binding protein [Blastocatellia bacterium]|nr:single-stranded DNA-binding protein [Blastocatellia bacterium]